MLLQAIRLAQKNKAFEGEFTPFITIKEILEREGEINSWEEEDNTFTFGSFGLNYAVVGPVRTNALDYLETTLQGDGLAAYRAIEILEHLLHNSLNRGTRVTSAEEQQWQNRERSRCLEMLVDRFALPASPILRARIFDAVRSGTSMHCPEQIQEASKAALERIEVDDTLRVVDAICTGHGDLPFLSRDLKAVDRGLPITTLMSEARLALERLQPDAPSKACFLINQLLSCMEGRLKTSGFRPLMEAFRADSQFLSEMADQLARHSRIDQLVNELSAVLHVLRIAHPALYRQRAWEFLSSGASPLIHAAAMCLRVYQGAVDEDVKLIKAYGTVSDWIAKRSALGAIAYMGEFVGLRLNLLDAALSINTDGDSRVASELAEAFGPYGVPLTLLSHAQAKALASQFLQVKEWDSEQEAIPRFLSQFVSIFPDETFELLLKRVKLTEAAELQHDYSLRTFGYGHLNVSFEGVPLEKRNELASTCIELLVKAKGSVHEYAELFWTVGGYGEQTLR
jgi:hypothetical protein